MAQDLHGKRGGHRLLTGAACHAASAQIGDHRAWPRDPGCSVDDLLEKVPGPDFPTGALICGTEGIRAAYQTGRGQIIVRARAEFEEGRRGERIVVSEIPYMVNKATLVERIVKQKQGAKSVEESYDFTLAFSSVINEFIAANPRHGIGIAQGVLQTLGNLLQQVVTDHMSE